MQAGAGRVLNVLSTSCVPLRPVSLALLLREKEKEDVLRAYNGDLLWSILCSIHAMCKNKINVPSYSDMVEKLYSTPKKKKKEMTNDQVIKRVDDMINMFLKGG